MNRNPSMPNSALLYLLGKVQYFGQENSTYPAHSHTSPALDSTAHHPSMCLQSLTPSYILNLCSFPWHIATLLYKIKGAKFGKEC